MIVFTMEHSKEFYESVIRIIDYLNEGNNEVTKAKGHELAGNYWREIGKLLASKTPSSFFEYGRFSINHVEDLGPIYEDCKNKLRSIDDAEHDRKLANEESRCNIKYGRRGHRISIVAIVISGIAILLELAKWIWPKL